MKSNFTIDMINDYANKLLIGLSESEASTIQQEFDIIEANMSLINEIPNIETIEPSFMPYDLYVASLREDKETPSVPIEDLLKNCGSTIDREIEVPKVVGQ